MDAIEKALEGSEHKRCRNCQFFRHVEGNFAECDKHGVPIFTTAFACEGYLENEQHPQD